MRLTRLLYLLSLLLFLPLIIIACLPQGAVHHPPIQSHARKTPLSLSTRALPARTSASAQAAADAATMASAPTRCPSNEPMPLSQHISGQQLLRGETPVWAVFSASVTHPLHLVHQSYDLDGGWPLAITWKTATSYQYPVTLRAINDQTGKLLKWHQIPASSAGTDAGLLTMSPILDPRQPESVATSLSVADPALRSWDTQLLIPGAGCYTIEAAWPESYWRITFSAGL